MGVVWWLVKWLFFAWLITGLVWVSFLAVMELKAHLAILQWYHKMFAFPFAAAFIVIDALFRFTFGTAMFLELPNKDTILFTGLCKSHIAEDSWRGRLARFWCRRFLDPFDEGGHCS
jgi:hypothetical protein